MGLTIVSAYLAPNCNPWAAGSATVWRWRDSDQCRNVLDVVFPLDWKVLQLLGGEPALQPNT